MGERTRYEPGTFCWVGLATSDPDSAKAFYASMFGWEAEDLEAGAAGTYTTLRHGGKEVAILYLQQPEARAAGAPPHWTSYISVEDADVTAARAGELGGAAVFREPFDVRHYGRVAAIRDPAEAIVSLWQPRLSHWLRRDLPHRVEALGLPVTVVTAKQSERARSDVHSADGAGDRSGALAGRNERRHIHRRHQQRARLAPMRPRRVRRAAGRPPALLAGTAAVRGRRAANPPGETA